MALMPFMAVSAGAVEPRFPTQSSPGTLSSTDRELLVTVRFANLWEIPMGQLAAQRGSTPRIREVGAAITQDHIALDVEVKKLADQFGVTLPEKATTPQQAWMAEISSAPDDAFDDAFANRLRAAHGTVFGLVAEVRAGTRNDVMRAFAQSANTVVMRHMTLLEGTGHVMPTGLYAEASSRTLGSEENSLNRSDVTWAALMGALAIGGTLALVRMFSSRRGAER